MKILFLPSHYVYDDHEFGSEPYVAYKVVDHFARINQASVVVTGRSNLLYKPSYQVIELMPASKGFIMSFTRAIKFNILYTIKAVQLLRNDHYDIIHHVRPFALEHTFNLAILLGFHRETPFVIGSFCSPYQKVDPSDSATGVSITDRIFRKLDKIAAVLVKRLSNATLKKAQTVFVYDHHTEKLVKQVDPLINTVIAPPGKDGMAYRLSKNASSITRFVSAGSMIERKGLKQLIESFSKAYKVNKRISLLIIGDGILRHQLESQINALKLQKAVTLQGRVNNKDMPNVYANSDVYVAMPREESFGQVYIEALAAGLPLVVSKTVGSTEIVRNRKIGFLIEQNDIKGMTDKMLLLANNNDLLEKLSINARKCFDTVYDWNVILPIYQKTYDNLISKNSA